MLLSVSWEQARNSEVGEMPECPDGYSGPIDPLLDFMPETSDELDCGRAPQVLIRACKWGGERGFKVHVLPDGGRTFHTSLEEALRRAIYGLGLEDRDIIVLEGVPGVSPNEPTA